jgi:hypothetical protein
MAVAQVQINSVGSLAKPAVNLPTIAVEAGAGFEQSEGVP